MVSMCSSQIRLSTTLPLYDEVRWSIRSAHSAIFDRELRSPIPPASRRRNASDLIGEGKPANERSSRIASPSPNADNQAIAGLTDGLR